jgi:hypothetical protein
MPKYTLHNVRLHTEQSEETTAFTSDLHLDGQRIARVGNDGKGGCHRYDFTNGRLYGAFMKWAATQPCDYEFEKSDQLIDLMLEQSLQAPLKADPVRANRLKAVLTSSHFENAPLVVIGDVLHWAVRYGGIRDREGLDEFVRRAVKASGLTG